MNRWRRNFFESVKCRKSLDRGCKKIGTDRITHHDLRHLFATRCIESGVDIPTVSRWLGHRDGCASAMKTYGHLRREHSIAQAQRVTFALAAAKQVDVVPFPNDNMEFVPICHSVYKRPDFLDRL